MSDVKINKFEVNGQAVEIDDSKLTELDKKIEKIKTNIGYTITCEMGVYSTFFEGYIPINTHINNIGVPIIIFNKDKTLRVDLNTNDNKILTFDASYIQTERLAGTVEVLIGNITYKIDDIYDYLHKGYLTVSCNSIPYNNFKTLLRKMKQGDIISFEILESTDDSGLYIQSYNKENSLVRLVSLAKTGEVYECTLNEDLENIFISNYSESKQSVDVKVKITFGVNKYVDNIISDVSTNKSELAIIKSDVDKQKNIIGYSIKGYNTSYSTIAENLNIPIGSKIKNNGVYAICWNIDKTERVDIKQGGEIVSTFEILHVLGSADSGDFCLEIFGISQLVDEHNDYILNLDEKVGANKTIIINDLPSLKNPIYINNLHTGTKLKIKITPHSEQPNRICLYTYDNKINDRLYDSISDVYGEDKIIVLDRDIDKINLFYDGFQPITINIIVYGCNIINGSNIEDKSITTSHLSKELSNVLSSVNAFKNNGTLELNSYLTLPQNHIGKNYTLTGKFNNSFENIAIGVGYSSNTSYKNRDYNACWVEIDDTNVKQFQYFQDINQYETKAHGLNITDGMVVSIESDVDKSVLRIYNNEGYIFEYDMRLGCGTPFIYNAGSDALDAEITFYPKELTANIWAFGDSYFNFISSERWPYYFAKNKNINWLSNNQPGLSPSSGYLDLLNLLSLNYVPKIVIWCLGMNGSTSETTDIDGNYIINDYQKTYIDGVYNLCKTYGIKLILSTMPTVPERQKTGFNAYVKSLGCQYIDFAKAVGASTSGEWYSGLLSSDNVHPSAKGAVVLASQVLIDAPELTTLIY